MCNGNCAFPTLKSVSKVNKYSSRLRGLQFVLGVWNKNESERNTGLYDEVNA